jgi:hypothetical protein
MATEAQLKEGLGEELMIRSGIFGMRDPTTWNGWTLTPTVRTNLLGLNAVATRRRRTWVTGIKEKKRELGEGA